MKLWDQQKFILEDCHPSSQPQDWWQVPSVAAQPCGGNERRVTVTMTSFGVLGHRCPPSCSCWDTGPLSSTASSAVLACFCSVAIRQDISVTFSTHTLTLSTCSRSLALSDQAVRKGTTVTVFSLIAQKSPSFGQFYSDLGWIAIRLHVNIVIDASWMSKKNPHAHTVIRSKSFDNEQTAPVSWEQSKDTRYCSKDQGLWLNLNHLIFFLHYLITMGSLRGVKGSMISTSKQMVVKHHSSLFILTLDSIFSPHSEEHVASFKLVLYTSVLKKGHRTFVTDRDRINNRDLIL